jgi:conjugal transfer pilus assembly protein TraB
MTGVDAPTGSQSSENVVSATFRITGPTIMPNGKRVDLTGCYVTAQVKGSLANERAFFRPDLITCDFSLGQIKTSLKGYVTSPIDGSVGIRGRLVSRAGDLLWNATLVGAIQGLSNAFGGNRSTNNSNIFAGGEPFSLPDTDVAAKAATTSAMSGAAEVLQQYFQDQLDAIYSIIEVRPLIPASIHLLDELTLKLMEPVKPQKLVDPLEAIQNEANASNQNNRRSNANLERPAT